MDTGINTDGAADEERARGTVTRFAPSPNGPLHLGHAYSAIVGYDLAQPAADRARGQFLLRIEDIDGPRSRPELTEEFRRDLEWLGLEWEEVPAQSTRLATYRDAAARLLQSGFLYRCACTRAQIRALPHRMRADGTEYPGGCGGRCDPGADRPHALRLDIDAAMEEVGEIVWTDRNLGSVIADPRDFGDVVIVRKDLPASYHLAATIDDATDGITLVTRGRDLFEATHVHRVLQQLLRLPVPDWYHHPLVLDDNGEKLAKRRGSPALARRRAAGEDGEMLARQLRLHEFDAGT